MADNPHFESPSSWEEAATLVPFEPVIPRDTGGRRLLSLAVFVRDHNLREVTPGERALEAYYEGFTFSQSRPGTAGASRLAYHTSYGRAPRDVEMGAYRVRAYDLGPEPEPDDPDPRDPAVVVWADGDKFFLLASETLETEELIGIGGSIYGTGGRD